MDDYKEKDDYSNAEEADFVEIESNNFNNRRVLRRSATNKILFGVCGGLAEYYLVHPLIFRLIFVIGFFYTNYAIVIYGILAFLIKPPQIDEVKPFKFSVFIGYSVLLYTVVYYLASKSVIFKFLFGNIDSTIYLTFLFAFIGLYIFIEAEKFVDKTATFNRTKLYKISKNKLLGGVCNGFSKYLQISVSSIRVVFIIAFVFTLGSFLLIYFVLYLTLPNYGEN